MRKPFLILLALLCSVPLTTLGANESAGPAPGPGKLVVHEWGTFTGFAGSDGGHLPFRADIGVGLPSFVLTRAEQADRFEPGLSAKLMDVFTKDESVALQRMETPVVYFYADAPRDVEARVDFPKGMLSEFYPPVRAMTPPLDITNSRAVLAGSSLDWGKLRITPASMAAGANVPKVEGDGHYPHARATDAAIVQFSDRPGEVHEENFLFYRGLGNFSLPVQMTAAKGDHFWLHNHSGVPIGSAFLIRIQNGRVRFSTYRNVRSGQAMRLPPEPSAEKIDDALVKALVAEGLYEKEARAMVKTWESSWFGTEGTGTRLLYTVPRAVTDTLLPLRITPTPDETVRVLVGRIDILTPEQEAKLAGMLRRAGTAEAISHEEASEMRTLGRFLQPAVQRVGDLQARKLMQALHSAAAAGKVNGG